jgi:hypothetical protein
MSKEYRKVAKELGVHYLFGRWGFKFGSSLPSNSLRHSWTFEPRFVPLDGWITDPEKVERIIRENGIEL